MKLIVIVIFTFNQCYGQVASIEMSKMNIAYPGIDNPMVIMLENIKCDQFIVLTDNGVLHKEKNCNYTFIPERVGIANIYFKRSLDAIDTIASRKIRIKFLPLPNPRYANKSGGNISVGEFKAQAGIIAPVEGFDIDGRFNIESFTISLIRRDKVLHSVLNHGGRIEEVNQYIIDQVSKGDKVIFDEIYVKMPGLENSQKLNSMIFEIK